ncbi:hypothetical protein D3C72_1744730 [compost metagenome]
MHARQQRMGIGIDSEHGERQRVVRPRAPEAGDAEARCIRQPELPAHGLAGPLGRAGLGIGVFVERAGRNQGQLAGLPESGEGLERAHGLRTRIRSREIAGAGRNPALRHHAERGQRTGAPGIGAGDDGCEGVRPRLVRPQPGRRLDTEDVTQDLPLDGGVVDAHRSLLGGGEACGHAGSRRSPTPPASAASPQCP